MVVGWDRDLGETSGPFIRILKSMAGKLQLASNTLVEGLPVNGSCVASYVAMCADFTGTGRDQVMIVDPTSGHGLLYDWKR